MEFRNFVLLAYFRFLQMEGSPDFANTRTVVGVPHKLKRWWEDIKLDRGREVCRSQGFLIYLIDVAPDRYLIKSILKFWDPEKVVFKFKTLS